MTSYNTPDIGESEVSDRLRVMRQQEEDSSYACWNYMMHYERYSINHTSHHVDEICRVMMCDWCYRIVDVCQFSRKCVSVGFSYLDRFLCTKEGRCFTTDREGYQLVSMTALYMAIKMHEPVKMDINMLANMSNGFVTAEKIETMERSILSALRWRLGGPTQFDFIEDLMTLMPKGISVETTISISNRAKYQAELAVAEMSFVGRLPSEIAIAAIANAIWEVDINFLPLSLREGIFRSFETCIGLSVDDAIINIRSTLNLLAIGISPATVDQETLTKVNGSKYGSYCHSPVAVAIDQIPCSR